MEDLLIEWAELFLGTKMQGLFIAAGMPGPFEALTQIGYVHTSKMKSGQVVQLSQMKLSTARFQLHWSEDCWAKPPSCETPNDFHLKTQAMHLALIAWTISEVDGSEKVGYQQFKQ